MRDRIAVDVDPLDVDAWRLPDLESDVHRPGIGIALVARADVGERVAEVAGGLVEGCDCVLDRLGVEPVTLLFRYLLHDFLFGEVTKRARRVDRAELVPRPLLDDIGDDEVTAVRSEFGERRNHPEIRIALCQVESAKLLLVGGEPVRIVGVVGLEESKEAAGLARVHFLAEAIIVKGGVTDDVDLPNLGDRPFVDFENQVDPVLIELDDLGLDAGREPTLPLVQFDDPVDVGTDLRSRKDFARLELDFRADLVALQTLVALKNDPVDDRIFTDGDDDIARVRAGDDDVSEQFGRVEILEGLVESLCCVCLSRLQVGIGHDRRGLETLAALDREGADRARGFRRSYGNGPRRCRCLRWRLLRRVGRGGVLGEQRSGPAAENGAD